MPEPDRPTTRTEADLPEETEHLSPEEKKALDNAAEVEHTTGETREDLVRETQHTAGKPKRN